MNLSLLSKMHVVCIALALVACSDTAGTPDGPPIGVAGVNASLSFQHDGALTLAPGETAEIVVKGTPEASYAMTFFLAGESLDASLNLQKTVADAEGVAKVLLRAPNGATNFAVRATIKDGPSADLSVVVSDLGFGSLEIEPVYKGSRPVDQWQARVLVGTCDSLSDSFPSDPEGALKASSAPGDTLFIPAAPVGPNLAVFVRAGGYAWGCSDEAGLVAGSTTEVDVAVINKPIDFYAAALDVSLTFVPQQPAWDALIASEYLDFTNAFFGGGDTALSLLSSMESASTSPNDFEQASNANGWLNEVKLHLGGTNTGDLAATLDQLKTAGLAQQAALLEGKFSDVDDNGAYGQFSWTSFGAVDIGALGVPAAYPMTITVDPDDTVHFGVGLELLPSRLLGATIEQAALVQYPASTNMVEVLADVVQCDGLHLQGLTSCTGACIAQLCRVALGDMWNSALEASGSAYGTGTLPLQMSGAAALDDSANLLGFTGSWLGNMTAGELQVGMSGPAEAQASAPASAR